jgi:Concanavalin A-like lectin/glucanases superfamily
MLVLDFTLNRIVDGTITDSRGSGPIGVCTGTTIVTEDDCPGRQCMSFNGTSSQISMTDLVCPVNFTIATWVKRSHDLSFYYAAIVAFGDDLPFFGLKNASPVLANTLTCPTVIDTSWNHLAAMQDSKGSRIYLNGQLIGSSPSRTRGQGRGMVIGCNLGRRNAWFDGKIASVTLFDEALPEAELQKLMRSSFLPVRLPGPIVIREPLQPAPIAVDEAISDAPLIAIDVDMDIEEEPQVDPGEVSLEAPIVVIDGEDEILMDEGAPTIEVTIEPPPYVPNWRFEWTLELDNVTRCYSVVVASVTMIEGSAQSEYEIIFSIELLGTQLLLPIRHPTPITGIEDCTRIFEECALAEFTKKARTAHRALEWLREHIDFME